MLQNSYHSESLKMNIYALKPKMLVSSRQEYYNNYHSSSITKIINDERLEIM